MSAALDQLARDAAFAFLAEIDDRKHPPLDLSPIAEGHLHALRTLRDQHQRLTEATAARRAALPDDAGDVDDRDLALVVCRVIG